LRNRAPLGRFPPPFPGVGRGHTGHERAPDVAEITKGIMLQRITQTLGSEAEGLLSHRCQTVSSDLLHLPGPDFIDRVTAISDRPINVLRNLALMYNTGRLGGTGYLSILPVDQGIEHSAGASFAPNPIYFDPEAIVKLGLEGGCNAVASTLGVLAATARKYAHKIPYVVKLNHNELPVVPQPLRPDHVRAGRPGLRHGRGRCRRDDLLRQRREHAADPGGLRRPSQRAHELGLFTILWCYLRNPGFKAADKDYHLSADLTGQANHLGVTIKADIIKQKMPENNGGYLHTKHGKTHNKVYSQLSSDHPIDLCRYQVVNCYMGRQGLINSGGASGDNDFQDAVKTAVINKRAGGMGLILGRKAFQKPVQQGIELLNAAQDVYLEKGVTIA
jgi:class I fructose-bisphosphate aldolase